MKVLSASIILFFFISSSYCQKNKQSIISGPRADNIELKNATIWIEVAPLVKKVAVLLVEKGTGHSATVGYNGKLGNDFNPIKIELNGLKVNTTYQYSILIDGKIVASKYPLQFTTKELWEWRKPAPDFTFLTGSCAYFNEPEVDRPGKPYGGDSSIFETMANTNAAFHLWLGDNWYTREVDYYTPWGLQYRASHDMSLPVLQKLWASMPQYAIWDDHDYGPNDIGKSYIFKDESREVFMKYWSNPSFGENGKGIYTKVSYSDVDFFLTDDRYFRSEDAMPDSINGQINYEKTFFGRQQMEWLKNALVFSDATFKIIATGNQVLNPYNRFEGLPHYTAEYNELLEFLSSQKIKGVIFFTGDRHHSEVIKHNRKGMYPLYDVTVSPYTSGISKVSGAELNSSARVPGTLVEEHNFGKVTITGGKNERVLLIEFLGIKGKNLAQWSVSEKDLK